MAWPILGLAMRLAILPRISDAKLDGPATSERYFGVRFYLEDLLGRPVDLVTKKAAFFISRLTLLTGPRATRPGKHSETALRFIFHHRAHREHRAE